MGDAQALAVEVQGGLFVNVLAPPRARDLYEDFGTDSDRATDPPENKQGALGKRFQRDAKWDSDESSEKIRIDSGTRQG